MIQTFRNRWWRWASGARIAAEYHLEPSERRVLEQRWGIWTHLDACERERLERLIGSLLGSLRWEAAKGFALTDEMQLLIAAQASLLLLGLDLDEYPATTSVIVHPTTVVLPRRRIGSGVGVVSSGAQHFDGQAHFRGPVVLSWQAVERGLRAPSAGHNVVYHEFAHQLDMLDGSVDGAPPLRAGSEAQRWHEVLTDAFERLAEEGSALLRGYGATNPGEFFAVATEAFFTRPGRLAQSEPELYEVMRRFYGQDPQQWRLDLPEME